MIRIDLNGEWSAVRLSDGSSFKGEVPGCVHTDLMKAGIIEENIYWRDHAKQVQWIENEDWMYTKKFCIDHVESGATLVFECLDTYSDIYLNGKYVANTDNMFLTHRFPIDGKLQEGENELTVIFHSPIARTKGCRVRGHAFTGERLYSRRLQCTYGWDWTMRFVTCGIERPCYIQFENKPMAKDVYVYTAAIDEFGAQVVCDIEFQHYQSGLNYEIKVVDFAGNEIYQSSRYCEEAEQREYISIDNPKLWYPLGYGSQPIYKLQIRVDEEVLEKEFGIRTVRILQSPDKPGTESYDLCLKLKDTESGRDWDHNEKFSSFTLIVNGKRIFCKGADWVPCEPFISEISDEKVTRILELSANAGINMIRVWGGGMFETEHFYKECNRLGIMVTQDFLMACGRYPEDEEWFTDALYKEAEFAARSLRNHPCLVWWTGDNENAVSGNDNLPTYPGRISALKVIEPVLKRLDPMRRFLPSSPYGGTPYASKTVGTTHNTQFLKPLFNYIDSGDLTNYKDYYKEYLARFVAEEPSMGAISSISLKHFMDENDILNGEEMWLYHTQTNPGLRKELFEYQKLFAEGLFGKFEDGQDRLYKLQYLQYEWVRVSFEMARRNLWFCSGLLYWMLADCWPAASGWAIIDYYSMPKASYYSFKRCAKGLVASIDKSNDKFTLHISNDMLSDEDVKVKMLVMNYQNGEVVSLVGSEIRVEAQTVVKLPLTVAPKENEIIICDIESNIGKDRAFYKNGKLEIEKCDSVHLVDKTDTSITLKADSYVHSVGMEGEYLFEDNYFSMLPGEVVTIQLQPIQTSESNEITVQSYSLKK